MAVTGVPSTVPNLRSYVRRLAGITMPELLSDATINDRLALAYREVELQEDWPWLEQSHEVAAVTSEVTVSTTVTETASIAAPGNPESVSIVDDATGDRRLLTRISVSEWESRQYGGDDELNTGEPVAYAVFGVIHDGAGGTDVEIRLWPHPEDAATLQFRTRQPSSTDPVTSLAADSLAWCKFDVRFLHALAYRAAAMILREEGDDSDRAMQYLEEYGSVLDQMRRFYLRRSEDGLLQMGGNRRRYRKVY